MEIREFSGNMKQAVEKLLGAGYIVDEVKVDKNNGVSMEALVIRKENINLSPTLYLRSYYECYLKGEGLKSLSERLVSDYFMAVPDSDIDMDFYLDYEKVKKGLYYKLISTSRNSGLLKNVPHIPFLDLDIVFYYSLDMDGLPDGSILIRNKHMELWRVGAEELMRDARMNSPISMPAKCREMNEVLKEMNPGCSDLLCQYENFPPIYVVSNSKMVNGASSILYPGVLEELSEKIRTNLYIIPSSVHEVIVMADSGVENPEYLKDMIYCINRSQLEPQDVLSDSLYYFNRETQKLTIAS